MFRKSFHFHSFVRLLNQQKLRLKIKTKKEKEKFVWMKLFEMWDVSVSISVSSTYTSAQPSLRPTDRQKTERKNMLEEVWANATSNEWSHLNIFVWNLLRDDTIENDFIRSIFHLHVKDYSIKYWHFYDPLRPNQIVKRSKQSIKHLYMRK